jgi:DNA-binding SARP family transcriptional activator
VGRLAFGVLGPLRIERDGQEIDSGGAKFKALAALLLLHEGELVATGTLIDAIWGEEPPPTADTALRGHVSKLRKLLKDDPSVRLESRGAGYALSVGPDRLDLRRFERLTEDGRTALGRGHHAQAEDSLCEALALWRAEPLSDLDLPLPPTAELAALNEIKMAAFEALIEAELALGHQADAIPRLEHPLRDDPLNERLHALAALAYYRSGRQSDALQVLERLRKSLSSELGLEPGPAIERLEHRILNHDPSLELPSTDHDTQVREIRKLVTAAVVHVHVMDPDPDPEHERRAVARIVEQARTLAAESGGSVYEELGGRLALVFGVPELHEDDAIRAVRSASDLAETARTWAT